jgi:aldehyde dehydrogenase (NAD+)
VGELLAAQASEAAEILRTECGRPDKEASGEVAGVIASAQFFASLEKEFASAPMDSSNPKRRVRIERSPIGVGALYTPFNTPLSQIASKVFPAILCGNAVILKAHELTPYIGVWFAHLLSEAGVPAGIVNVLQGDGESIGAPLARHSGIAFISFTGSSATGARIVESSASRLAKVSIEAGGKNAMVICDDADLDRSADYACASILVDNGQRCAATSRLIVFDAVYEAFLTKLLERIDAMKIGPEGDASVGALISRDRRDAVLAACAEAVQRGARIMRGGHALTGDTYGDGYFMEPTLIEGVDASDPIAQTELFGPVAVLFRVGSIQEAITIANNSPYRLASAIHTKRQAYIDAFSRAHLTGVMRINGPTFGSEPHMPFGGPGLSGNGWREPGVAALNFYADLRQVSEDL